MIVVCTRCQAKFRVADEKVGPRGAKVRCSRCQNVFLVHRDLGSMPLDSDLAAQAKPPPAPAGPARPPTVELDLEPGGRAAPATPVPQAPDPFGGGSGTDLFTEPAALAEAPPLAEDPFLAATRGPPEPRPQPAASLDPFAAALATPRAAADPFAATAGPFGEAQATSQVAGARPDPFAAPPAFTPAPIQTPAPGPSMSPMALPVTDLSDLMGGQPVPEPDGETSDPDFALEARPSGPKPRMTALEAAAEAAETNLAAHSAERHEAEFYSEAGSVSIGLANEPARDAPYHDGPIRDGPVRPERAELPTPVHVARATPPSSQHRARARAPAGSQAEAELAAQTIAQRLPRLRRASRVRSIALNALALVVLVIVSLALLVLVRSGGKLEPGALRPSSVLRALGGQALGTFAAIEVTSGAYDRAKGPPLLFVRGRAISRDRPVRALRVSVDVLRRGEVVARGQALAGAVLTPEELNGVTDAAMLAALGRNAEARVPSSVKPGEGVPFLVAIADYPGDLSAAALRLTVTEGAPGGEPMSSAAGDPGDAARALARRLAALEEGRIRARAAARALGALTPERGLVVVAALAHQAGVEARVAIAAVAQAFADPDPELPYGWRAELYSAAARDGAHEVGALLLSPPPLRAFEEPFDKPDRRLAHLTLGHKKAFARSHRDPDLLARLAAEGEPVVVRELLNNPQLTEEFVIRIAARRPCRPQTLRCLFESRRWRTRPAIALAVARNPYTEPEVAVKLVPLLAGPGLAELARDATVHPLVRGFAERMAERGRSGRRAAAPLEEPSQGVTQRGDAGGDQHEQRHEEDDETDLEHGGRT